jgi:hypothetical protein
MNTANQKVKITLASLVLALALPILFLAATKTSPAMAQLTNTGKIYLMNNVPKPAGYYEKCFLDTRTNGLRDRNENAMANNWACKCVTGIGDAKNGSNPTSWLINASSPSNDPKNYDYEAKLRENNAVDDYCRCRNNYSAGYCSCVYADKRPEADCKEYKPPQTTYKNVQSPDKVTYASLAECRATGQSYAYCNCRMNGGSNDRCYGILGSNSSFTQLQESCIKELGAQAPATQTFNYCSCTAAGTDEAKCQASSGIDQFVSGGGATGTIVKDPKASQLTDEQKKRLASMGLAEEEGTSGDAASGGTSGTVAPKKTSRLLGLPSIVPECARKTDGAPPSLNCLMQVFGNIANLIIGVTGSIALLMFVWGGFKIVTAAGNDKKVGEGKEILENAIIGIFIIMLSGYVVNYAMGKLGVVAPVQGGKCQVGVTPVKTSASGNGIIVNAGGTNLCVASGNGCKALEKSGFACTDYRQREGGQTDCITGICGGDKYNICCPTK